MPESYPNPVPQNFLNQSDSYYRILSGKDFDTAHQAFLDYQRTGLIRGTPNFSGRDAYFNKGYPDPQYYAETNNKYFDSVMNSWGEKYLPSNYVIEASPKFINKVSSGANPLYKPNALSQSGGGSYFTLESNHVNSFLDRINPANRIGTKVTHFTGSTLSQPMAPAGQTLPPAVWSRDPNPSVLYDTTKPFTKTSIGQHARNAAFEAGVFLEQPEVKQMAGKMGTFGNYLGLVPMATSEYRRATSDFENPVTGETYKKDEVVDIGGQKFATADAATIAMFHPDNAENHPEITDAMRKKFNPDWFKE